jgi:hypothetical protein
VEAADSLFSDRLSINYLTRYNSTVAEGQSIQTVKSMEATGLPDWRRIRVTVGMESALPAGCAVM